MLCNPVTQLFYIFFNKKKIKDIAFGTHEIQSIAFVIVWMIIWTVCLTNDLKTNAEITNLLNLIHTSITKYYWSVDQGKFQKLHKWMSLQYECDFH